MRSLGQNRMQGFIREYTTIAEGRGNGPCNLLRLKQRVRHTAVFGLAIYHSREPTLSLDRETGNERRSLIIIIIEIFDAGFEKAVQCPLNRFLVCLRILFLDATKEHSLLPQHKELNRYQNIAAYDHTRVAFKSPNQVSI